MTSGIRRRYWGMIARMRPQAMKQRMDVKSPKQAASNSGDWISSRNSGLRRFADSFEFTEWPAFFECDPHDLYILGIPKNAVLPMMSLIEQEWRRFEGVE